MKITKKHVIMYICVLIVLGMLLMYRLPYYIYQPGGADPLEDIVSVEDGYQSEGNMHLVTVRGGQATPLQWLWAKFASYQEILPIEAIRPKEMSEEEYRHAQLQMMENSQEASIVVAYEAAGKDIDMDYQGVYIVSVESDLPAFGKLEMGDSVTAVDDQEIHEADDLIAIIEQKQAGDTVQLDVVRDGKPLRIDITLEALEELDGDVGMGVQLVTDRKVEVDPPVAFSSGGIGGPSAGLMFALEIYNQLTDEDLTKGYEVIGTGGLNYDGTVYRIGGIDKKVVAADKAGCDIFFAPYEDGGEDSNYEVAKRTAEDIGTDMDIVPISSFEDALDYLEALDWKE